MKKMIISFLLLISTLQAATVNSQKNNYEEGETLTFTLSDMSGDTTDWIGVYPVGASNNWENVKAWTWTHWSAPKTSGTLTLDGLPNGNYEVRVFFHNSYNLEASNTFTVGAAQQEGTIHSNKTNYTPNESIIISVEHMSGDRDWVGIYPVGASNDWDNVISWKWTYGVDATLTFAGLQAGNYEARAFYHNSFITAASTSFSVQAIANGDLQTDKNNYTTDDAIIVTANNLSGDRDWVGIYPAGANNDFGNILAWKWVTENEALTFNSLAAGSYEARLFFHNSFHLEASKAFSVTANNLDPVVYENAENGIGAWETILGPDDAQWGSHNGHNFVTLATHWHQNADGSWTNPTEYHLPMNNNSGQHILSVDFGGSGQYVAHYVVGVRVSTTLGARTLKWSSSYVHYHIPASNRNGLMIFPSPVEQVRGWFNIPVDQWETLEVNLEDYLHQFEPNNHITSVDYFTASGGVLDNIILK